MRKLDAVKFLVGLYLASAAVVVVASAGG